MELSTGILSGYIILNCWGRTNLVSMQLWQSLWWLFPPYLSFSRSTHVVSRWILESEPLVWMMYTKCYFFPITVYLDSEKSLTKEEDALCKGFLSLVMNWTKRISCMVFHHHRDQTLPEGDGRTTPASCSQPKHPHLCHMVLRLSRHWDCVGKREGRDLICRF